LNIIIKMFILVNYPYICLEISLRHIFCMILLTFGLIMLFYEDEETDNLYLMI